VWIEDEEEGEEFVISPHRAATSRARARSTQPWYRRTVSIVLLLVFFFPVGLVLLWLRPDWPVRRRGIITAAVGIVVILAAVSSPNPPPTTTTVLSPTVVGGTATSPGAPTASRSATPSSVATTSPALVMTSAPSKTTAAAPVHTSAASAHTSAAPVHTSAAPVHTTKAPQPVRTTAKAQSCYPLTNSGNCYKPGEYCRNTDHGKSGIDASGDAIKCEDNDGWRWERV
jgi:hypothetical protein